MKAMREESHEGKVTSRVGLAELYEPSADPSESPARSKGKEYKSDELSSIWIVESEGSEIEG